MKEEEIGAWMKHRLHRTDILLESSLGVRVLTLLESFLQCYYEPTYEGFASQRSRTLSVLLRRSAQRDAG